MEQIFGDFVERDDVCKEYLIIHFSPTSIPLQQRWRNNGLSADFVAEYWSTFLPIYDISSQRRQQEAKGAIGYIANEMLENVIKFSHKPSDHPVSMELCLYQDEFKFYTHNAIDPQAVGPFQVHIRRLLTEDTGMLYLQQLESNVLDKSVGARLGLLMMINDYDARLAWKFESDPQDPESFTVTTMAQLAI